MVRKLLAGLALSIFGTVMALVLIEIGFRVMHVPLVARDPWNDRPTFYYSPESSPNMQDFAYSDEKPANTFRIAVVGDSFTFAPYLQFDDTFVKRLERMLNLNTGQRKVEVINYGVPRYSSTHEIEPVEQALKQHADLVLLQITLNDPEEKPYRPTGLLQEKVNRWGQIELNDGIYRHWKSLAFVVARLYNRGMRDRYVDYFTDLFKEPNVTKNFKKPLQKMAKMCKDQNVPLMAVTFPLFGLPLDEHYPFHPIHQKVASVLSEVGIPGLDLYAPFDGLPIDRLKVMPIQDYHPNEIAHRIAAESIYRWLVDQKALPEDVVIRHVYSSRIDKRKPAKPDPLGAPAATPPPGEPSPEG